MVGSSLGTAPCEPSAVVQNRLQGAVRVALSELSQLVHAIDTSLAERHVSVSRIAHENLPSEVDADDDAKNRRDDIISHVPEAPVRAFEARRVHLARSAQVLHRGAHNLRRVTARRRRYLGEVAAVRSHWMVSADRRQPTASAATAANTRKPLRADEPLVLDLGPSAFRVMESTGSAGGIVGLPRRWSLSVTSCADGALQADLRPLIFLAHHQRHALSLSLRVYCPATGVSGTCDWAEVMAESTHHDVSSAMASSVLSTPPTSHPDTGPSDGVVDGHSLLHVLDEVHSSFFCCELMERLKGEALAASTPTSAGSVFTSAADAFTLDSEAAPWCNRDDEDADEDADVARACDGDGHTDGDGAGFQPRDWDFRFRRDGGARPQSTRHASEPTPVRVLGFSDNSFTVQLGLEHILLCSLVKSDRSAYKSTASASSADAAPAAMRTLCKAALLRVGLALYTHKGSSSPDGRSSSAASLQSTAPLLAPLSGERGQDLPQHAALLRPMLSFVEHALARQSVCESLAQASLACSCEGLKLDIAWDPLPQSPPFAWHAAVTVSHGAASTALSVNGEGGSCSSDVFLSWAGSVCDCRLGQLTHALKELLINIISSPHAVA